MTKVNSEHLFVDSSFVNSIQYFNHSESLYAIFKNNTIYCYDNVKPETFERIRSSDSIGKALHNEVFKICSFTKIK